MPQANPNPNWRPRASEIEECLKLLDRCSPMPVPNLAKYQSRLTILTKRKAKEVSLAIAEHIGVSIRGGKHADEDLISALEGPVGL